MTERRRLPFVLAAALLAACAQDEQDTPFMPGSMDPVSRTIDRSGGQVSSPAGLSLEIPDGAIDGSVEVTVTPKDGTDVGAAVDGRVLAGTVFELEPDGLELDKPAALQLGFEPGGFTDAEALGLAAVAVADGVPAYLNAGTVDLNAGIINTRIQRFGTVGGRVAPLLTVRSGSPGDDATGGGLFATALRPASALRALADGTVTYTASCGPTTVPCTRDDSPVSVYVSANLIERFAGRLGAIGVSVDASLTFSAADATVTGQITMAGVVRARAGLSITSKEIVHSILTGAAGEESVPTEYTLAGTSITLSQTPDGPVTLHYSSADGRLTLVLPPTQVELEDRDGTTETGVIAVTLLMNRTP